MSNPLFAKGSRIPAIWAEELKRVNRPSAATLIGKLVPHNPLGYSGAIDASLTTKRAKDPSKLRVVDLATGWKELQPGMVLLVRLGDFYEAWGMDAVMLVQHAGLNPMGDSCRAGCPKGNIQQTLNSLTDAGLSVAVYEEANLVGSRSKKVRKERYLSQVVTPGRPIYLHDMCLKEGDLPYRESKPYTAIRCAGDGCSVAFIWVDAKEVRVTEAITEDAISSLIEGIGGIADPAWVSMDSSQSARLGRVKSILPARSHRLPISLSLDAFLAAVTGDISRRLSLSDPKFRVVKESVADDDSRMKPLHASAAQFLGLTSSTSPDLVKNLVSATAPFHVHFFWRNWLLCPPPREVAECMHRLVKLLSTLTAPIPKYPVVPVDKLVRLLESRNGNFHFFLDLHHSCASFEATPVELLRSPDLLTIVNHHTGLGSGSGTVGIDTLLENAKAIQRRIESVVHVPGSSTQSANLVATCEGFERFTNGKESEFIKTVRGDYAALTVARERLWLAVTRSLVSPDKQLKYDQLSDTLYVKEIDIAIRPTGEAKKRSIPDDSARKRFSTDLILKAESEYRVAVDDAKNAARAKLQTLCETLSERNLKQSSIMLSHWAVVTSSAVLHVEQALRRGWTLPVICDGTTRLNSVWPYWLEPLPVGPAVVNDCELSAGNTAVLTAPNMSGKSTLIRAMGAAMLLGNCGLMVPCASASVHRITDLLVVSPNGDRPSEGVSAFAAEADALSVAIREAAQGYKSVLMLIDEFGRGTSGRDASALSAAVIEWLSQRENIACVWATHLHELFDYATLDVGWIQMEGFHLLPGKCTDSKGIATAQERGFPIDIVNRAYEYREIQFGEPTDEVMGEVEVCPVKRIHRRMFNHAHAPILDLGASLHPPPAIQSSPVVYILKFANARYYIGETENFGQRLKAHKLRFGEIPENVWIMEQLDRSRARSVETSLIREFLKDGINLLSIVDGNHSHSSSFPPNARLGT